MNSKMTEDEIDHQEVQDSLLIPYQPVEIPKTIKPSQGRVFVDMGKEDFLCPHCQRKHDTLDWYDKYNEQAKRSNGYCIEIRCKGCRKKIALTVDMTCCVVVWIPEKTKATKK